MLNLYELEPSPITAQMFGNAGREHMKKYGKNCLPDIFLFCFKVEKFTQPKLICPSLFPFLWSYSNLYNKKYENIFFHRLCTPFSYSLHFTLHAITQFSSSFLFVFKFPFSLFDLFHLHESCSLKYLCKERLLNFKKKMKSKTKIQECVNIVIFKFIRWNLLVFILSVHSC